MQEVLEHVRWDWRFIIDSSRLLWELERGPALLLLIKSGERPIFTLESSCAAPPSCPFLQ